MGFHRLLSFSRAAGLVVVSIAVLLAACMPPAATVTPAAQETLSVPVTAAFPVSIEHKYGSTTLEQAPERVVSVGLTDQDALLALGVVPVATREWYGQRPGAIFPWAEGKLAGAALPEVLGYELDFEKIAQLQPDLIVGLYSALTQEEYDKLSQIAPTIAQPGEYVDWGIPWQAQTLTLGRALGRESQAEALVAEVEAKFSAAREQHPEFKDAAAVVAATYGFPESFNAYSAQDARGRFITSLGFRIPDEINALAGEAFYASLSRERLDLVDQDVLIWFTLTPEEQQALQQDPLYQQLAVSKAGRDLFFDASDPLYDALNFNSVLSLPYAVDGILPRLEAALGGSAADTGPAQAAVFPVTIQHKFGAATIPAAPERVVSLGYSEQDPILALGVKPVAVRNWFGDQPYATWPWAQDELGDAQPEVLTMAFGELNFEAIVALDPDVIIATHSGITEEEYQRLAEIAPTVAQPGEYVDFGVPWQEQTAIIGRALGREAQAREQIAQVEEQIRAAGAANPAFQGATIAMVSPASGQGQYWVFSPNTPPLRFLTSLGFVFPEALAALVGDRDAVEISSEQIQLLDVDVLIWQVGSEAERESIQANPLYQQLGVTQEGRDIFFIGLSDTLYGSLSFSTVLSLPYAVEYLVPQLAAAVDGDPATVIPQKSGD